MKFLRKPKTAPTPYQELAEGKTSLRDVIRRFLVLLGLIALVNLVSHTLEKEQIEANASSTVIVDVSGRQRMLSQRISLLAELLVRSPPWADRLALREEMAEAVETLETSHEHLIGGASSGDSPSDLPLGVRATYFEPPLLLDEKVRRFTATAKVILQAFDSETAVDPEDLEYLLAAAATGELLSSLNQAVTEYRREAEAGIAQLERLRQWRLRANLFFLLVIGLFVFRPMAGEIRRNLRHLNVLNMRLEQRVLAQKQAQEALAKQTQELARSNAELERFASVASHDLQEPLRKIKAFGDRLHAKFNEALGPQGSDYVLRMQHAAERMQALIDSLLTLSRVTSRAQPFERVNLDDIVKQVLTDLEVRVEQAGARINLAPLPTLEADSTQMRQLLQNLIGNALKFCRPERPPLVKVYSHPSNGVSSPGLQDSPCMEACQIVVEDNGVGFDPKHSDRLFGVFQRLHSRREYEGTGVGLAICRKIAERHKGTIEAKSQPLQGAKFIVTLPLKQTRGDQHSESAG